MKGNMVIWAIGVALIIISTLIIMNAVTPLIEKSRTTQTLKDAEQIMTTIDSTIREIMTEASGSRRSLSFNLREGKLVVNDKEDRIKFRLENANLLESGVTVEESNILVSGGGSVKSYESDIENDGDTDLVLENSALLFAIQKVGSPESYAAINTTIVITQIKNMRTGINITPASGIFINNVDNTSYGNGFTELTQSSDSESRGIRVFVNSTGGVQYEALFTLQGAKDFIDLQVKRIV
ncbi:MAG: hypothetical protein QMD85_02655 [Candidatus Aenigmarchaeota archaeon]|nr:hypothetical protein [Candidatus Aenigmarchaeota archaeon]MDI6722446.1 hypothetical protein [Candidatus Aenigmarchaeota archaeon]